MGRGWLSWITVAGCCALLAACGGRVVQQGGTGSGGTSSGGTSSGGGTNSYPSHALGDCHPGPYPTDATTCPWLGDDGRCYQTVDDACNCVCPRDHVSVCVSASPGGPKSMVQVSCY